MLLLILYVLAHPVLLFFFFRTTKEFPKSWWEFKFEIQTIFCGLRSQNEDLFLLRRNRISWVMWLPKRRYQKVTFNAIPILELIQLPNQVAVITGGNRGIGLFVVQKLLRCGMTVVMGEIGRFCFFFLFAIAWEKSNKTGSLNLGCCVMNCFQPKLAN